MTIEIQTDIAREDWDRYVLRHPDGLGYHLSAWCETVRTSYGFSPLRISALKAGKVCGVLPLIAWKRPLSPSRLISLPFCDAGCCLADDADASASLVSAAISIAEETGQTLELRAMKPLAEEDRVDPSSLAKVRMLLSLPEDGATLKKNLKAKLRSQVNKPFKDGLTARFGGSELLEDFYTIYSANMHLLGSPAHSFRWFKNVMEQFADRVKLCCVAMPGGEPAASGIILLGSKTVSIPWASSARHLNRWNPNMMLYWSILEYAADQGFATFDFGRSTPGEGTYRFKKQWGANPEGLYWYRSGAEGLQLTNALPGTSSTRQVIESIWRKIPEPVCTQIGSRIRKYFPQ